MPCMKPYSNGLRRKIVPAYERESSDSLGRITASPNATLEEAREHLQREVGVSIGLSAVCRALSQLGLPRKKSRSTPASGTRP